MVEPFVEVLSKKLLSLLEFRYFWHHENNIRYELDALTDKRV